MDRDLEFERTLGLTSPSQSSLASYLCRASQGVGENKGFV